MSRIAITGGRILQSPDAAETKSDLYIKDGLVIGIGSAPTGFQADTHIIANNGLVLPGITDLSCRLFTNDGVASPESELKAAAAGGITDLCMPPDSITGFESPAFVKSLRDRLIESGVCNVHLLASGLRTLPGSSNATTTSTQAISEMRALADAGASGVWFDSALLQDGLLLRRALEYAQGLDLNVFVQPADIALARGGCAHEGAMATRLGLPAISVTSETAAISSIIAAVEQTQARVHLARISSAAGVELIRRAKSRGLTITADVSLQNLYFTDERLADFNVSAHLLPPLRAESDRQALIGALEDGSVDAVCSDHNPHGSDAKTNPFPSTAAGASACELLLPMMADLVSLKHISPSTLVRALITAPRKILSLPDQTISVGSPAQVSIVAPCETTHIDSASLHSAGHFTPFDGAPISHQIVATIRDGQVSYQRD